MNNKETLKKCRLVSDYVCDKAYRVVYRKYDEDNEIVVGLLVHYDVGSMDLVNVFGLYHIDYTKIIEVEPVSFDKLRGPKDFIEFVNNYLGVEILECV